MHQRNSKDVEGNFRNTTMKNVITKKELNKQLTFQGQGKKTYSDFEGYQERTNN